MKVFIYFIIIYILLIKYSYLKLNFKANSSNKINNNINNNINTSLETNNNKNEFDNKTTDVNKIRIDYKASYVPPPISRSLFERDPTLKLMRKDFLKTFQFTLYSLDKGEANSIFDFADIDKDDLLDHIEWNAFLNLFVYSFEDCDVNKDFVLDLEEWSSCWDYSNYSKLINVKQYYLTGKNFNNININNNNINNNSTNFSKYNIDNLYISDNVINLKDNTNNNKYTKLIKTPAQVILEAINKSKGNYLNFSDYVLFRRATYGFTTCQTNKLTISKVDFKCALNSVIPDKFQMRIDMDKIYEYGVDATNEPSIYELDYISFLRITIDCYIFSVLSYPNDEPYIEKSNFINSIREERWSTKFTEKEVDIIYDLVDNNPLNKNTSLNIESFLFFFNIHRLFNSYSKLSPISLSLNEFLEFLNDPMIPYKIIRSIDLSLTNFSEKEYSEGSLVIQRLKYNERDFFSFVETISKSKASLRNKFKIKENIYDLNSNTDLTNNAFSVSSKSFDPLDLRTNNNINNINNNNISLDNNLTNKFISRKVLFSTLTDPDKSYLIIENVYRGFQTLNLFTNLCNDKTLTVLNNVLIDNLIKEYDIINPPISIKQRDNYNLYKSIPREVNIDALAFLQIELGVFKIKKYKSIDDRYMDETMIKMIMKDYGMENMPDSVIDLGQRGFDKLYRRRYDPIEVCKYTSIASIVAGENKRREIFISKNNLKASSYSIKRPFPLPERRQMYSIYA